MDTVPGLKALQARKRELLLTSDLNRQALRLELTDLRLRTEQFRRGYGWAQHAWIWAAPVAGFLFARKARGMSGWFAKGSLLVTALGGIWKAWRAARQGADARAAGK